MTCKYCGAEISSSQSRCGRCQRRLDGGPERRPRHTAQFVAAAVAPQTAEDPIAKARARFYVAEGGAPGRSSPPVQPPLFTPPDKVVGLDHYLPPEPPRRRPAPRRTRSSQARYVPLQAKLDFDAPPPDAHEFAAAQLRMPVASPARRAFAFLVDLSFVLVGFALFLALVRAIVGFWPATAPFYAALGVCLWLLASLYHFLHAAVGRRTPGQCAAGLLLITREGRLAEPVHRVKRVLSNAVPVVSLMGAAWAAITEEHLTFADLITGTYLTIADSR